MTGSSRLSIGKRGNSSWRRSADGRSEQSREAAARHHRSNDEFAADLSTIFVCPVSSDLQDKLPLRPQIEAAPENGLRLRSQIMTDKMVALPRDRIRRVIGRIDTETSKQLDSALLVVLGLAR